MKKITGYQRFQLRKVWLKSDQSMSFEDYVKAVCKSKGLEYVKSNYKKRREAAYGR